MTESFNNKVALITGAAAGIGKASAIAFSKRGAKVVIDDIDVVKGEETAELIRSTGGEALFVKADVTNEAEVEMMVNKAVQTFGRLDYAHNNAGLGDRTALIDATEKDWDRVINTNLKSIWMCMKYELRHMTGHGGGAIVNTASLAGIQAYPNGCFYSLSKWGVIGLTKSAALEYAAANVRINSISPAAVAGTSGHERMLATEPEFVQSAINETPLGRIINPEEVADAVVWLCSDEASYIIGHNLVIDGGIGLK